MTARLDVPLMVGQFDHGVGVGCLEELGVMVGDRDHQKGSDDLPFKPTAESNSTTSGLRVMSSSIRFRTSGI